MRVRSLSCAPLATSPTLLTTSRMQWLVRTMRRVASSMLPVASSTRLAASPTLLATSPTLPVASSMLLVGSMLLVSSMLLVGCGAPPVMVDAGVRDAAAPTLDDAASPLEPDAAPADAGPAPSDAGSPVVTADAGPPVLPDAGPTPSFDHIYEDILRPRCARCHIDVEGSRLYMPDVDTAYAALVDVPVETSWAAYCGVAPEGLNHRVRPYDLAASMLSFLPDCYVRDADHGYSTGGMLPSEWMGGMTPEERAEVQAWISAGAPRRNFE